MLTEERIEAGANRNRTEKETMRSDHSRRATETFPHDDRNRTE